MRNYITTLTPFRGLAAIWIVVYHFDDLTKFAGLPQFISREFTMLSGKGYLWVDFFFILSGFIISHVYGNRFNSISKDKVYPFIKARFARLYPLHVLLLLVHIVFYSLLSIIFPQTAKDFSFLYPWDGLWIHFVFGETFGSIHGLTWNPPAWSIGAEWWTYVLAIPMLFAMYKYKNWTTGVLTLLSISILLVIPFLHDKGNFDTTYEFGLLRCIGEFSMGVVLYRLYQSDIGKNMFRADSFTLLLTGIILFSMHLGLPDLLVVLCFALLILGLSLNQGKVQSVLCKPVFQIIGDISFSLYMFQALWLNIYWMGMKAWVDSHPGQHPGNLTLLALLLSILFLNIVSAWFSYRYFEGNARNWIKSKSFRKLRFKSVS